jgi:hypothetical protein
MSLLIRIAVTIVLSGCCSWTLAWYSCTSSLPGLRLFDFVCGHNAWLQMLPSFFVFAVIFSLLIRAANKRLKSR